MSRPEFNSASVAQSQRNALPAEEQVQTHAEIERLSAQALNGDYTALTMLLERVQYDDEACNFLSQCSCQQDITVLAFLIRRALQHDRTAYRFLAEYGDTGNDIALMFLLERVYAGDESARKFFEEHIREEDNRRVVPQEALVLAFLIGRLQEHDPMAYELLYGYYTPITWKYLVYAKGIDKEMAYDLTQQVFEKVWTAVTVTDIRLREKQNFKKWVARIRENKVNDYLDHRPPEMNSLEEVVESATEDFQPEVDRKLDSMQSLQRSLDALSPQYREALHRQVFEEGSQAEKAQAMGIKESTFSSYVARARKELKARYEQSLEDKAEMKAGGQVHE